MTRFGEVEKSHVELSTAQLLRSHALVALLPPQLKAAHEFTSRPHKTFGNQEPHNLHRERDVFEIARSRTFGPQVR